MPASLVFDFWGHKQSARRPPPPGCTPGHAQTTELWLDCLPGGCRRLPDRLGRPQRRSHASISADTQRCLNMTSLIG